MRRLGQIIQVQIQREPLKKGERPARVYDPAPLLVIDQLRLTPGGLFGLTADGLALIDVHHSDHPRSRNRDNANGLSFNFTSHYDRMRRRFGSHLYNGCAGENILIESEDVFNNDNMGTRLAIRSPSTGALFHLGDIMVAAPCAEFARYSARDDLSGQALREALDFLADGTRGFYATPTETHHQPLIQPGDEVYVVD
jgi:hypothetical protein